MSQPFTRDWGTEWLDESGRLHRLDGPAIEHADGYRAWYAEGKIHRLDGPAIEHGDGTREWWVEGKLHRLDGPAVECADGTTEFWRDGVRVTCLDVGRWRFLDTEEEMTTRPN